ncbi:Lon protease C-terminal proteolytic domain-containing protein, partial [Piptocephalis cylindrospora]
LARRIKEANFPVNVRKEAEKELTRFTRLSPVSMERGMLQSYLDWLLQVPWLKESTGGEAYLNAMELSTARSQLDGDHCGLEGVKERIIQYLAVLKLRSRATQDRDPKDPKAPPMQAPILCLIGPPGVGKTSLGRSVAKALQRPFSRVSLGGVRDEAEIRGHRRTYVSSLPGTIVREICRCQAKDPIMLLDEIDKVGTESHRGDPASALLEVLDPEQNGTFTDHYLGLPLDLSKVLFIATANREETIPEALKDRMEVIHLPGYTLVEKVNIGLTHLLPKQLALHGLAAERVFHPHQQSQVMEALVGGWTREAGVRELERCIAALCRSVAVAEVEGSSSVKDPKGISVSDLEEILGPKRFDEEVRARESSPGLVTGLAYHHSGTGGIMFIECVRMPGEGKLLLTGQLGDVMEESAKIALSWVKSQPPAFLGLSDHSSLLGKRHQRDYDIHIHCPAGAIKKDGPSAGLALVMALVSMMRGGPGVDVGTAMTGEVTLRGEVLPVGGIREKLLGARRAGVWRVLIPRKNEPDVKEAGSEVQENLTIVYVSHVHEALEILFND